MDRKRDPIFERIIEYCQRVSKEFELKKVLLFGSRSRGDFYPHSDIDLLLISDDFPQDWFKRQARLHFLKLKQIEPIGYTTAEINKMLDEGNLFIKSVFREGKEIKYNKPLR
jgi:predicted nucleotidyltransferase